MNRVDPDEPRRRRSCPSEALTLEQAFAAYTSGSAHVNHLDDTGVLAPGLLADLAVLDRDPFAGDPAAIGATRVVATYVDGVAGLRGLSVGMHGIPVIRERFRRRSGRRVSISLRPG